MQTVKNKTNTGIKFVHSSAHHCIGADQMENGIFWTRYELQIIVASDRACTPTFPHQCGLNYGHYKLSIIYVFIFCHAFNLFIHRDKPT